MNGTGEPLDVSRFDAQGRLVLVRSLPPGSGGISVEGPPRGLHVLRARTTTGASVRGTLLLLGAEG